MIHEYEPDDDKLFGINENLTDPEAKGFAGRLLDSIGIGPFLRRTVDDSHVVLLDPETKRPVYKNSAGSVLLHVGFIESWYG